MLGVRNLTRIYRLGSANVNGRLDVPFGAEEKVPVTTIVKDGGPYLTVYRTFELAFSLT